MDKMDELRQNYLKFRGTNNFISDTNRITSNLTYKCNNCDEVSNSNNKNKNSSKFNGSSPIKIECNKKHSRFIICSQLYHSECCKYSNILRNKDIIFDLGIMYDIAEYLNDYDLDMLLAVSSYKIKYLYFHCPTDIEYKNMRKEEGFIDKYAIRRTKDQLFELLKRYYSKGPTTGIWISMKFEKTQGLYE